MTDRANARGIGEVLWEPGSARVAAAQVTRFRAEAARLRQGSGGAGSVAERDGLSSAEEKLRALKRKHERGALGDEEYRLQREDLLRGLSPSRVP